MPNKNKDDEKLLREPHGDVSIYRADPYVAPGVMKRSSARTIVPRRGEIDQELIEKSRIQDAGNIIHEDDNAAQGGLVMSDYEDPKLLNGLTPGTSQQTTPAPIPQAPPMTPPPSMSQAAPQIPPPMPQVPPPQLPGMPPHVTPDDLEQYLGKAKSSMNTYGPEAQMALQDQTLKDRNSWQNRLTSGAKGFADALMQGVAGAGNPGWQQQFENQQDRQAAERMGTLKGANEANIQRTSANMNIDRMSPDSALSKAAQETYAPLFEKLGYPEEAIKKMSNTEIQNAMQLMAAYGGKEKEAMIKEYELEIERARMAQAAGKQSSEEELAHQKMQVDAASEILKRGENSKFLGIPIPFTSEVPQKEKTAARKVLMNQVQGTPQFKTEEEAEAAGLPDGTPVVIGGVRGKWSHQ